MKSHAVSGILNAFATVGYVYIATYLSQAKNDDCLCASGRIQDAIMIASIVFGIISFSVTYAIASGNYDKILNRFKYGEELWIFASLIYIVVSFIYTYRLSQEGCTCAEDSHFITMRILFVLIGLLVTYGVFIITLLIVGGAAAYFVLDKKT